MDTIKIRDIEVAYNRIKPYILNTPLIVNENIRLLKVELGDILLEYNYLSSPEKLLEYQSQYFENDLIQMDITKIKKITEKKDKLIITNFNKN